MPSMHASTGRLFRALAAFEPAPGVLYEVPLRPDEVIELLENDAPDGWLFVRVPRGLEARSSASGSCEGAGRGGQASDLWSIRRSLCVTP